MGNHLKYPVGKHGVFFHHLSDNRQCHAKDTSHQIYCVMMRLSAGFNPKLALLG
jgi:hypothetical protein